MSLWRYRRSIALAVAGDLVGKSELNLREHLRGCEPCRTHYNTLSQIAGISSNTAAERQRARLEALLPQTTVPRRTRPWVWAMPVLVPALLALLWLRSPSNSRDPSVSWRGGAEPAAWPVALVLYEFPQGANGPPAVLGELPFSQGVRVARDALLQLAYTKLQRPTFLFVVGTQADKRIVLFPRRPQDEPRLEPASRPKALGASLKLHAAFDPGELGVWIVASTAPLAEAKAVAAIEAVQAGKNVKDPQVFVAPIRLLP